MVVVERGDCRMLIAKEGKWGFSKISCRETEVHQPIYHKMQEFFDRIGEYRSMKEVLVLGAGGCAMPRYFIKRFGANVTAVEISNVMIDTAKKYFYADSYGEKLMLVEDDAFHYVKYVKKEYDVIFVDLFNNDKVIDDVFDVNFLSDIKKIVFQDGIIIFNVLDTDKELLVSLRQNFKTFDTLILEGPKREKEIVFFNAENDNI